MNNEWAVQNTITKNIDDIVPYDSNPREHAPEQIEQVANSIKEFGWTMPILIDENNEIIAGHGRLLAGKSLGIKEVPCIVAKGWSDEKKKAYCIADNKLTENSTWSKDFLKLNFEFLIDNEFDLAKKIEYVISNYSKALVKSKSGIKSLKRFSIEEQCQKYFKIIKNL